MNKRLVFVSKSIKGKELEPWDLFSSKDADYYNDKFQASTPKDIGVSLFIRTYEPYPEDKLDHEELFLLKIIEKGEENPFEEKEEVK